MAFATKPKPPAHHKKRIGQHRKQSTQYVKHYWPYLPLLFIIGSSLVFYNFSSPSSSVLGDSTTISKQALMTETNNQRAKDKVFTFKSNALLDSAAQSKANDMVANDYWSHVSPSGKTPWSFITNFGYNYEIAGENLAYGFTTSDDAILAWMNSTEHRKNLLSNNYTDVGYGIARSNDYLHKGPSQIIVALYAKPSASPAPTPTATSGNGYGVLGAETTTPISRGTIFSSSSRSAYIVIVAMAIIAAAYLLVRHSRKLHSSLVRGEKFVLRYWQLDVLLVTIIAAAIVLSQTAGYIR